MKKELKYYSQQSKFSEPGEYRHLYSDLPNSVAELTEIIQGIVVHQWDTEKIYGFKVPKERQLEPNTRYVSKILEKIVHLKDEKLTVKRKPENRFVGLCRDFAILLCSILRHKNIPARLRCGFASYYEEGWYVDHWLCEYWNKEKGRWMLVDTEVNEKVREEYKIYPSFNHLDVNHDEFILSGRAWQMCCSGEANPDKFGVPSIVQGLWFVMGSLIRDLGALNKIEVLPWDYTKFMDRQFKDLSALEKEEIGLLNETAKDVTGVYKDWERVRKVYKDNPQIQIKGKVISYTHMGPKEAQLNLDKK